jgi:DUF4097 and DUF4098 domain-containing protein YvlB
MDSRNILRAVAIIVWSAVALTTVSRAGSFRHSVRASSEHDEPIASCSDLNIEFENRQAVVQSEERKITKSEAATLRVKAQANGGLQVEGWDKNEYSVTLCKAADPETDAQDLLSKIHLTFENGEIEVTGPDTHTRWSANLLVKAPKAASLDLQANNGPVGLFRVDGKTTVHAQNGPITVSGCSGELDLSANNGPVTLEKNSGKLRVEAQNGPVTVSLNGTSWTGSGIEAHANNGPLTLRIPEGYQSGVLVESDGHSPFRCRASACSEARKNWDDERKSIAFGSGPTMIHLSTMNGPLSIN